MRLWNPPRPTLPSVTLLPPLQSSSSRSCLAAHRLSLQRISPTKVLVTSVCFPFSFFVVLCLQPRFLLITLFRGCLPAHPPLTLLFLCCHRTSGISHKSFTSDPVLLASSVIGLFPGCGVTRSFGRGELQPATNWVEHYGHHRR